MQKNQSLFNKFIYFLSKSINLLHQKRIIKNFLIKFTKKLQMKREEQRQELVINCRCIGLALYLLNLIFRYTLGFIAHGFVAGFAEMYSDNIDRFPILFPSHLRAKKRRSWIIFKTADGVIISKWAHKIICPSQTVFSFLVRGR